MRRFKMQEIINQVASGEGGALKRGLSLTLRLAVGRRTQFFLSLFLVGGVVHHMTLLTEMPVLFLVVTWGVICLGILFVDMRRVSQAENTPDGVDVIARLG
jgi:hypothetical protein